MKTIDSQMKEVQQTPNRKKTKKITPCHITIKLLKISDNEKNLQSSQRKKRRITCKGMMIRILADQNNMQTL